MLGATHISELLGVTRARTRQLVDEHNIDVEIGGTSNRIVKFPPKAVRQILKIRGFEYERTIVTIGQEKGGIGKSLLTFNVAVNLSKRGAKVLVIDLDPEACLTNILLAENAPEYKTIYEVLKENLNLKDVIQSTRYDGIDLVGCKGVARRAERIVSDQNPNKILKNKMEGLEDYDLILFDVPPTFSRLISSAYLTSDLVIMPTFPDAWSIESLQLTIDDIEEDCEQFDATKPDIKILVNKYLPSRKASQDAWKVISEDFGQYLLPFCIKDSAALQNSINDGFSIMDRPGNLELKGTFNSVCEEICPLIDTKKAQIDQ